mgnify:FL=1
MQYIIITDPYLDGNLQKFITEDYLEHIEYIEWCKCYDAWYKAIYKKTLAHEITFQAKL